MTISGTNLTGATAVQVQRDVRAELHGDVGHVDSGDGAGGGDDGTAERDDARRHGDQREQLHGEGRAHRQQDAAACWASAPAR